MCVCDRVGNQTMCLGSHISQDAKGPSSVPSSATLLKLCRKIYKKAKTYRKTNFANINVG